MVAVAAFAREQRYAALAGVIALVLLFAAPTILPGYYVGVASRLVIIATFATAFNVVYGMGGMPSLGHAAFFGAGGYTVALGLSRWGWDFWTIIAVTVVVGALLGVLFGILCQKVEGIYLLLLTLALAQALWGMAFQQVSVTRGDMGLSVSMESIPLPVDSRAAFHYFTVVVCLTFVALLWGFMRSPFGRAIVGTRESPSRMGSLGYNVAAYKLGAFFVSGLFSALTGALYAYQQGFVGVDNLGWVLSATVLLAAILGGARNFLGPALGATILIIAETILHDYTARWMSALGLIYIVSILVLPDGVLGLRRHHKDGESPPDSPSMPLDERTGRPVEGAAVEGVRP